MTHRGEFTFWPQVWQLWYSRKYPALTRIFVRYGTFSEPYFSRSFDCDVDRYCSRRQG